MKVFGKESSFLPIEDGNIKRAEHFIILTGNSQVDHASIAALENLRLLLCDGVNNDLAKFAMPECYRTELTWTINARSLQNFLQLRSHKRALWEICNLAHAIFEAIPKEHQFIFAHHLDLNNDMEQ
ncbi:MAG: FAD-dependent thymidylate synthase [Helicobacter sp.]|nr:FAD-dependent thymidylate synthase [Helicobacter sp.]